MDAPNFQQLVKEEVEKARRKHPRSFPSAHYFYAVLLEEVDEFWDLVKAQKHDREAMLKELVQIGAMAQRAAEDIGLIQTSGPPTAVVGESLHDFYYRTDPDNATKGLANLLEVHGGKVPPIKPGETLAAYFHRTDPL